MFMNRVNLSCSAVLSSHAEYINKSLLGEALLCLLLDISLVAYEPGWKRLGSHVVLAVKSQRNRASHQIIREPCFNSPAATRLLFHEDGEEGDINDVIDDVINDQCQVYPLVLEEAVCVGVCGTLTW